MLQEGQKQCSMSSMVARVALGAPVDRGVLDATATLATHVAGGDTDVLCVISFVAIAGSMQRVPCGAVQLSEQKRFLASGAGS